MIKVTLTKARETKNTFRYEADKDDAAIQVLYIEKAAFNGKASPDKITVTVE